MAQENKKLGDLYKEAFNDFEAQGNSYDWNDVEKRLDKMKFYKLSFTHFNIYYSLLIVTCFIASLISATHYFLVTVPRINSDTAVTATYPNSVKTGDESNKEELNSDTKGNENNEKSFKEESDRIVKKGNTTSKIKKENLLNKDYEGAESVNDKENTKNQSNKVKKESIIPTSANGNNEILKRDSVTIIPHVNKEKDSLKVHKPLKTPKKTVYITKQDTIFEYDTLKTKKNRRFRK